MNTIFKRIVFTVALCQDKNLLQILFCAFDTPYIHHLGRCIRDKANQDNLERYQEEKSGEERVVMFPSSLAKQTAVFHFTDARFQHLDILPTSI